MKKILLLAGFFIFIAIFTIITIRSSETKIPQINTINSPTSSNEPTEPDIEVISNELRIPWEVVFINNDTALVTERPGNLIKVDLNTGNTNKIHTFSEVASRGEGGLLGMALHPNFSQNKYIFFYLTVSGQNGLQNRVERYEFNEDKLINGQIILEGISGESNHDGGRISFGPDGYLYVTTGDAQNPNSSQNTGSLNGKILRIKDDGDIPSDNPFENAVYSYGHRNPQGIAWDNQNRLWATEHGPSGLQTGNDELNLIKPGINYGWPEIKGTQQKEGMQVPILESGTKDTWAPGQIVYHENALYFVGLRGSAIYKAKINNGEVKDFDEYFKNEWGRLRTIVKGPDGYFYILTNNTDGRGIPKKGDDKLIKIDPSVFN